MTNRALIDTGTDKRYVRRDEEGPRRQRRQAKNASKAGEGDKGDRKP